MRKVLPPQIVKRCQVVPRFEAVAHPVQCWAELGKMAKYHADKAVVVHPSDACAAVDVGGEILGNEAITFESTRRHQDKDAKRSVTESEARWRHLTEQPDHQINAIDIV